MATTPVHEEIWKLILSAEGPDDRLVAAIEEAGPERTADLLASELIFRADLHEIGGLPTAPITVQLELEHQGGLVFHHVRAGGKQEHFPGTCGTPHATIRMALSDLLRSVLGPWRGPHSQNLRIDWHDIEEPARLGASMHVFPVVQRLLRGTAEESVDLAELSLRNGSDKWGIHFYTPHYTRHFTPLKDQPLKILELGIGGFGNPASGGGSLRMWKRFFPRSVCYGVDIFDKTPLREPRIHTIQGDMSDAAFLAGVGREFGPFDIVIDDGSHNNSDVIVAFGALFPFVRGGGRYVVEDLQTSYWPGYGGSSPHADDPATSMGFLKRLLDGLHHAERGLHPSAVTATDLTLTGAHIYRSLAILDKGVNREGPSPSWIPRQLMTYEQMSAADWGEGLTARQDSA